MRSRPRQPGRRVRPGLQAVGLLAILLAVALGAVVSLVWGLGPGIAGGPWLLAALGSRLFLTAAGICLVCGVVLAWVLVTMWQLGRQVRRRRRCGDSGSVLVEFTLLLPIALAVSLGMLESSLLMAGNLCVHYSAYCAARSAIVQLPRYNGPGERENEYIPDDEQGKYGRIHAAAVWPLIAVSYGGTDQQRADDADLVDELIRFHDAHAAERPFWLDDRVGRKLAYALEHTFIELDPPADGKTYQPREDIRVRVRHTYYLSVPYAGWFFSQILDGGVQLDADGAYGLIIQANCTLSNEGVQDWIDIEQFDQPAGGNGGG